MSRHDPTLPSDTASLSEADLITLVKTDRDSAALMSLVTRHSGIYFSVVNRYAATYPNTIKARDMDDDKLFNLDTFIQAYDPTRGTKLSTYIRDRTDYLCKTTLKRDARNPLSSSLPIYMASGSAPVNPTDDTHARAVVLTDESSASRVTETANLDLGIADIRRAAGEVCADPRFGQILDYRHSGSEMSWREVGKRVGVSHEGARKIYTHNLALVKAHLST